MPKADPEDSPTEAARKRNAAWAAEADALTGKVGELFCKASIRFAPPDEWWCGHVARALLVVRDREKIRRNRLGNDPCGMARKYAGLFLMHAPLALTALDGQARLAEAVKRARTFPNKEPDAEVDEAVERTRATVHRLQDAVRAVEACRADLDFKPRRDRDAVRFIAEIAREAWASTNDGEAPRGKNTTNPLVKFVAAAFGAIGMTLANSTVSAALRGTRRTRDK